MLKTVLHRRTLWHFRTLGLDSRMQILLKDEGDIEGDIEGGKREEIITHYCDELIGYSKPNSKPNECKDNTSKEN